MKRGDFIRRTRANDAIYPRQVRFIGRARLKQLDVGRIVDNVPSIIAIVSLGIVIGFEMFYGLTR